MAKIKVSVRTTMVGSEVVDIFDLKEDYNIDEEEWNDLSDEEKDKLFFEWICDNIDWYWSEIE